MANSTEPFVRLLRQRAVLTEAQLARAEQQAQSLPALIEAALNEGANEEALLSVLATLRGIPGVDLSRTTIDLDMLDHIPLVVAQSDLVLPMSTEGGRLHVAVSGAQEGHEVLEELRFITGQEVSPYCALPGAIAAAINEAYLAKEKGERFWRGASAEPEIDLAVVMPQPLQPEDEAAAEEILELEPIEEEEISLEIGEDSDEEEEVLGVERVGPAKVLAVDDDPDILKLLERALKSAGYVVELAEDGKVAEEKLKAGKYDLVLLDAMLPHVHGFELCARLKSNPRTRKMPVILVSAVYRGWRYAHDARESFGADEYIEKPFHIGDLLRRVKECIDGAQAPQPAQSEKAEQLFAQAMVKFEEKEFAEAQKLFNQALVADPFSARAQFGLGRAMHESGDLFGAITAYERAVELRPTLFPALRSLAGLYEQKGFRKKAAEALERAASIAPDAATRDQLKQRLLKLL